MTEIVKESCENRSLASEPQSHESCSLNPEYFLILDGPDKLHIKTTASQSTDLIIRVSISQKLLRGKTTIAKLPGDAQPLIIRKK